jgi:hypothetical protein
MNITADMVIIADAMPPWLGKTVFKPIQPLMSEGSSKRDLRTSILKIGAPTPIRRLAKFGKGCKASVAKKRNPGRPSGETPSRARGAPRYDAHSGKRHLITDIRFEVPERFEYNRAHARSAGAAAQLPLCL